MSFFLKYLKFSVLALSLLTVQTIFAASDADYLKQLEMEAGDDIGGESEALSAADNTELGIPSSDMELIFDKKGLISDEVDFAKALKESYPESYALYLEFTEEQKKLIYQNFIQKKRLYISSVKIISLYLRSH